VNESDSHDGTNLTGGVELGKSDRGVSTVGIEVGVSSGKDGASAAVKLKGRVEGNLCPDENGRWT
jgi:hypothetical protein